MRWRSVLARILDVLLVLVAAGLVWRVATGDLDLELGPFKIGWKRVSRIVHGLLSLAALRVLVETRGWGWLRPGRAVARLAFGRGEAGDPWPVRTIWWLVPPILGAAAGATFGLTHAGRILLDRAGMFDDAQLAALFLLAWVLKSALLGLALGATWALLLALGRHLRLLPAPSAKDVKLTVILAGIGATAFAQASLSDWTYPTRLGGSGAAIAAALLALGGAFAFGVVLPALARRSQIAFGTALAVPFAAILLFGFLGPRGATAPEGRPPRHVVLISIDTLRADRLGCYGYAGETSPDIDALADEGVLFERAFVPQSATDPSHVTMLTGVYPREHGVITNGYSIANPGTPSLAEWFRSRGYATAAFTSRSHLNPDDLLLPGFDTFSAPTSRKQTGLAHEVHDRAVAWLERHAAGDFFVWIHVWDPHNPYEPPGGEKPRFTRCGYQDQEPGEEPTPEDLAHRAGLYDEEIRYADRYVGEMVRRIEALSPDEPPLIVIVGDHGEILGEYYEEFRFAFDHAWFLNDALLRVPLIVRWKGRIEPRVVPDVVESVDLAATIAALVEPDGPGAESAVGDYLHADAVSVGGTARAPTALVTHRGSGPETPAPRFPTRAAQFGGRGGFRTQRPTSWYGPTSPFRSYGTSLVPLLRGEPTPLDGLAVSQRRAKLGQPPHAWLTNPAFAVRDARWRYVKGGRDGEALYDVDADPLELRNVLADHPDEAARLRKALEVWKLRIAETPPDLGSLSDEKLRDLKALGYFN